MGAEMNFSERLLHVQAELKAPKDKENDFGHYRYRSCESILEAVKPLLKKYGLLLSLSDEIVETGSRVYVKATATICDVEGKDGMGVAAVTAYAREPESKKGTDESQVTGGTSSYARKYALNGLFLIDDTKDADTNEARIEADQRAKKASAKAKDLPPITNDVRNADNTAGLPFSLEPVNGQAWTCAECGKPVKAGKVSGKEITVEQIVKKSMDMFGETYCYPCMAKKANGGK